MDREYDIFETMPDGAIEWRAVVSGHENAIAQLKELASKTPNEVRVMYLPTKTIIAAMNTSKSV